jgi:hypothetical protein
MDAAKTFFDLQNKLQPEMDKQGVYVEHRLNSEPYIRYGRRGYGSYSESAPDVEAYEDETRRIQRRLSDKKREMIGKIWGVDASIETIDKEIQEFLKDL